MAQSRTQNKTRTIAANSFWYGSEIIAGIVLLFATSIPLARALGPDALGYFNYITWLTSMGSSLGGLGIPSMCGKFVAEYLGRDEPGVVRAVFARSLRIQLLLATVVSVAGILATLRWGDPQHRTVTCLQVLAMMPAMLAGVPAQANVAYERMQLNVPGTVASSLLYLAGVIASLWFGWGLLGVASSFLVSRFADCGLKLVLCWRWMAGLPLDSIPSPLGRQMRTFAQQQVLRMTIGLILWDRSDVVLLKLLSHDIKQVTFFTIAFNLSEKVMLAPSVFGAAVSASLMAQYGRDKDRMKEMAAAAVRYMFLSAAPLLIGMAVIAPTLIPLMYGADYKPVSSVLMIAAFFGVLKSLIDPADALMRANNRQLPGLASTIFCAALNIAIDYWLIPPLGAMGAAFGNGLAQTLNVILFWTICIHLFSMRLDYAGLLRILVAALAMVPAVLLCNRLLPPLPAVLLGVVSGAVIFCLGLRISRLFNDEDRIRLGHLEGAVPGRLRPALTAALDFLMPASVRSAAGI